MPLAFDFDNRTLYVASREDGDKAAIHRYDFEQGRVGERLARHLDVDMGNMIFSRARGKLLGVVYDADRPGVVWLDEQLARLQQMVDRALPNTVNTVSVADQNPKRALVAAHSDTSPVTFYLLDTEKPALTRFASSRPWIKPDAMSERKFVRYKARDGLEIPAYLTIPKQSSGKNLPLVVEIHGGPWINKQSWGFNERAQFFASRGYTVLQPDFRGTRGYGKRHYEASFGQWGFAMQDDITDGVEWLVSQGIADRSRVCLFGGSYGGYATLWGLIKTPDLYRCGVAFMALTDIAFYFSFNRWDLGRAVWGEYGARTLIGDPERDRDKFRSVSPIHHAERLKAPVLLVYGGVDQRVPLKNGTAIRSALDRHGKKYEWVVYDDEGHGFGAEKNRFDFYRRVDAFLKQHLN
jgi:dipeptidyl aminopeptidase/acylaminoacyl peptidase